MLEASTFLIGLMIGFALHLWLQQKKTETPAAGNPHPLYQIAESLSGF